LIDRSRSSAVHEFGPSFDLLATTAMFLILFDPAQDFAVSQTLGDLFLQGNGINASKFQKVLVEGAGVVVFAVFFEKGGAALV